jgi:putative transposase
MTVRWSCSAIQHRSRTRDGAIPLLRASRASFPFVERAFADAAYAAERAAQASRTAIEIVHKLKDRVGFAAHPRRRVVE